jgi:hypothetical protein
MNNQIPIIGQTRLSEVLRFGLNSGGHDASFWDGKLRLLPKGGGSGDEETWTRLVLEEFSTIGESACMMRMSGPDLFMDGQDFSSLKPSSIIAPMSIGHGGTVIGISKSVSAAVTVSGGFRLLLVAVIVDNFSGIGSPTSISAGGIPLLAVPGGAITGSTGARLELYYLLNPPTGSLTTTATWSGEPDPPAGSASKVMGVIQFANVKQSNPFRSVSMATGGDSNPRTSPTSERGDYVVDAAGFWFEAGLLPFLIVNVSQVQRVNRSDAGNPGGTGDRLRLGMSTQLGDVGSILMDWDLDISGAPQNRTWVAGGISLFPAV